MKEYYDNYPAFIEDLNQKEKTLKSKLQSLYEAILDDNTIDFEIQIPDILIKFKDIVDKLNEAYLPENAQNNVDKKIIVQRQKEIKTKKSSYDGFNKKFQDLVIIRYGTLEKYMKAKDELKNDETLKDIIETFYSDMNSVNSEIKQIKSKINNLKIINDIPLNKKNINKIQNDINNIDNRINKIENDITARGNLECLKPLLVKISGIKKNLVEQKKNLEIKRKKLMK